MDVLSGSYDGPLFLFRGDGKGSYRSGAKLAKPDSAVVQIDSATSVSLYDWDKDGKPDLFIGTISGPVWYAKNLGGGKIEAPIQLSSPEGPMDAPDGGPCAVDWDKDGAVDLFLGAESGRLLYFRGKNGGDRPSFDKPVELLRALSLQEQEPMRALPGNRLDWGLARPQLRPKPTVCDWNGDGKLDLLVGDFCLLEETPRALSTDKAKLYTDLRAEQDRLRARSLEVTESLRRKTFAELGWAQDRKLTDEEAGKYSLVFQRLYGADTEATTIDKRLLEVFDLLSPLMPETGYHGFVWMFRHK